MRGNVLIMAGGTGGHVFPALACAREFQARGYAVHWLGTPHGIENELVPAAGLPLHLIQVSGLRGKGKLSLLKAPFQLVRALFQARKVMRELQPAGLVPPFDAAALASTARSVLAQAAMPAVTMQRYRLQAMQESTLALYQTLVEA